MLHGHTAPRPEGQVLTRAVVLVLQLRHRVGLGPGRCGRITDGELTDPSGRRQVALHQRRGDRQHLGIVVEALGIGVVGRQQRLDVDVQPDQITHGVPILEPVQAMRRHRPSPRRGRGGGAVQLRFQPGDPRRPCRGLGLTRRPGRHHPGPDPPHDLFPQLRVPPDVGQIEPLERDGDRADLNAAITVTADAVAPDERRRRLVADEGLSRGWSTRERQRGGQQHAPGPAPREQAQHGHHLPQSGGLGRPLVAPDGADRQVTHREADDGGGRRDDGSQVAGRPAAQRQDTAIRKSIALHGLVDRRLTLRCAGQQSQYPRGVSPPRPARRVRDGPRSSR